MKKNTTPLITLGNRGRQLAATAGFLMLSSQAFGALIITPAFTANFTSDFGVNAGAAQASWNAAAAVYTNAFSDQQNTYGLGNTNVHINITVDAVTGTGILGESSQNVFSFGYSTLYNALVSDATSTSDLTAVGVGGSYNSGTSPVNGATWWVTRSQEKALSLIADDNANDGTTTFGTGFSYTFNTTNGAAVTAGTIDFFGVAGHEISEIMGRIGLSGASTVGSNAYTLVDALSYSGAGTRVTGNTGGSFSINNGATLIKAFNNAASLGGDSRDWASGANDSFNAFSSSGVSNPITATDLQLMDVLGYDPVKGGGSPTPEPSTGILLVSALAVGGFIRRRAKV